MRPRLSFILLSYGLLALAGCFSIVMPESMDMSSAAMAQPASAVEVHGADELAERQNPAAPH
jgi:hypothetical protein